MKLWKTDAVIGLVSEDVVIGIVNSIEVRRLVVDGILVSAHDFVSACFMFSYIYLHGHDAGSMAKRKLDGI